MTPLALSGLLTAITSFSLIVFVALVGQRNALNLAMIVLNLCVGVWGIGTMLAGLARTPTEGVWAWRVAFLGGMFLAPSLYHLSLILRGVRKRRSLRVAYILALGFVISYFGPGINQTQWLFNSLHYNKATLVFLLSFLVWLIFVSLGHAHTFYAYRYTAPH